MPVDSQIEVGRFYFCYTSDTKLEDAEAAFKKRYGYPPEKVVLENGVVWAGPIKDATKSAPLVGG